MAPAALRGSTLGRLLRLSRHLMLGPLLVVVSALALSTLAAPAAHAAPSRLQVFVGGGQMFISPPSADDAIDSANDVLVDLYADRIEVTERSGEVTLEIHPAAEAGCVLEAAVVTCTQSVTAVTVNTRAGDDRIVFDQPEVDERTLNADCGSGADALHAVRTNAAALLGEVVGCETTSDELPDEPPVEVDPFGVSDGLRKVPLPKVTAEPYCAGRNPKKCGSFTYWNEAKARQRLEKSGLNLKLAVTYVTKEKAAQKLLAPSVKNGTITNTSNITDGDILKVSEVLYDDIYKTHRVDKSKFRASTHVFPYVVRYWIYQPPAPDPDGKCPYATGIFTDVDPQTKGRQTYDVRKELLGTTRDYAVDALERRFDCRGVRFRYFPELNSTAETETVRDVLFDKVNKAVLVELDVPARPDLVLQLSGRPRTAWLDSPADADLFDGDLGPLVDGTFAAAPGNRTTVNVRLFERVSGKPVLGLGRVLVIDDDGDLLADVGAAGASVGGGDTTLSFTVKDTRELWFVGMVQGQGGRMLTSFARRAVVDAGSTIATARGAVFSRDDTGTYQRDTVTPLSGPTLSSARTAVETARTLLAGAPEGTAAGQARAIIETNAALIATKPTAILRHIHEQTGFELAGLHAITGAAVTDASLDRATPGGIVVLASRVATTTGVEGGFATGIRPAASGVTATMAGPLVSMLGGNSALGHESGGFIANGEYIVDLGPAPPAASTGRGDARIARRGFADWFTQAVAIVAGGAGKLATGLQRAAAAVVDGAVQFARSVTGGTAPAPVVTINARRVTLPPTFGSVPEQSVINAGTTPVAEIRNQPIAPAVRLRDSTGLLANDGASLLANDGTSLMPLLQGAIISNDGGGIISNDGGGLLANDGASYRAGWPTTLISDHGAGLISDHGGGIVSNHSSGIVAGGAGN